MSKLNQFDLSGKVSMVTGAGSGLGRVFCEAMAESGSDVACVDINETWAKETTDIVAKKGVRTLSIRADVSNQQDVKTTFRKIEEVFGKLDILLNNAGVTTKAARLHEMPLEYWNHAISVDLTGVFFCMQEGITLMLQQKKGSIINISSIGGLLGMPGKCNYSVAKAGVIALTKSAAVEYGPDNIRVNAIAPGMFGGTRLGESAGMTKEDLERRFAMEASKTPLRRIGEPVELKGIAIYLASEASSFITGSIFVADGGYIA